MPQEETEAVTPTPVAPPVTEPASEPVDVPATPSTTPETSTQGIFCNQCGWKNPAGARFCSQCGASLDARLTASPPVPPPDKPAVPMTRPTAPAPPPSRPVAAPAEGAETSAAMGKQIGMIVGTGVMLVLVLYMISVVSQRYTTPDTPPPQAANAPAPTSAPLSPETAAQAQVLIDEIAALTGPDKLAKQYDLVNIYIGAVRYDLAGDVQYEIAEVEGSEFAWVRAGNLYYDWMDRGPEGSKTAFAKKAIAAYQKALEINPDNLSVRTDMAIAYMYDPDNPMEAIQQTNMVLEADPNHVQANFNRGIMLMQINRLDQAIEQMEKVKRIVGDPSDNVYQRAEAVIASIRQRMGTS